MKQALNATFFGQQLGLGNEVLMAILLAAEILICAVFVLLLVHILCTKKSKKKRANAVQQAADGEETAERDPLAVAAKAATEGAEGTAEGGIKPVEAKAAVQETSPEEAEKRYRGPVMIPAAIVPVSAPDPRPGAKGQCRGFAVFPPTILPCAPDPKRAPIPPAAAGGPRAPIPLPYAPAPVAPMVRPPYPPVPVAPMMRPPYPPVPVAPVPQPMPVPAKPKAE